MTGLYEAAHSPKIYEKNQDIIIDKYAPIQPDSFYALTKVYGENLGRILVNSNKCSFKVIRICSVRSSYEDNPYAYAERGVINKLWNRDSEKYNQQVNRLKGLWQSRRDFLNMISLMLQNNNEGFDIFFGVSNNDRKWFDIKHAEKTLGYHSIDNSEKFTSPPSII